MAGRAEMIRDQRREQTPVHGGLDIGAEGLFALLEIVESAGPLESPGEGFEHEGQPRCEDREDDQQGESDDEH